MKETDPAEKRFLRFQNKLLSMMQTIDELLEDPLFMDAISGTEEVGLDQTKEFLNNILADLEDTGKNIMTVDEIIASRLPEET
jgi:hypothetical protein